MAVERNYYVLPQTAPPAAGEWRQSPVAGRWGDATDGRVGDRGWRPMTSLPVVGQWRAATPDALRVPANSPARRRRRCAGARTRSRSCSRSLADSPLRNGTVFSRPTACRQPPNAANVRRSANLFHTDAERERSPVNANGLREHFRTVPVVYRNDVPFFRGYIIILRKSPTPRASNVHRFASQFACTSGEP